MSHVRFPVFLAACGLLLLAAIAGAADEPAATGPQTEKRFPPLQVPDAFKATLFACDPLIEYPSAIALGPRPGSLFVATDYLTGLGSQIDRRDEIRLIEDTDGDGYADKATVFASGFNSIQGLAYHNGTVYVMHAPYLTALRDTKGIGKADERRDLLKGLGLPPETDPVRLHNANGVVAGHDGWLYLALGDHGCDVARPEGDRLVHEGGGILRCRPDGRDLHVYATGLRNIYDIALDEELNVFVRDNENDGGDYKIRVCHSFFGADHGYPYLYYERPDEALAPLADLGLGSSAGGVCYLERQFPAEYRGSLFFCEWGRAVVRYQPKRSGAAFAPLKETDFATGAPSDPYGFKPTDLVVDREGALFIADWADGQQPRRGRGRIYHIRYVGNKAERPGQIKRLQSEPANPQQLIAELDAGSYFERCQAQADIERRGKDGLAVVMDALSKNRLGVRGRLHVVWIIAKIAGPAAVEKLFDLATSDPDPRVRAQAVRALADLADPVLVRHRLDAGAGDAAFAAKLADLAAGRDSRVLLETAIALGRLRWPGAPDWLRANVKKPDAALTHAAQWTLRRAGNRLAVLKLLDERSAEPFRAIALRAVAKQYDVALVDGLIDRLKQETDSSRRREYADALTRVYKKPAAWVYWGFRPPPRPANSVAWERTEAIEQALNGVLADNDRTVRLNTLRGMVREKVLTPASTLGPWLRQERESGAVADLLAALRDAPAEESRPLLETVIRDRDHAKSNRLLAVSQFVQGLDAKSQDKLLATADNVEDGPVLVELLRAAGKHKTRAAGPLLLRKLSSADSEVRACAVSVLSELNVSDADGPIRKLLDDREARVRSAAGLAAGKLALRAAADPLLKLARDPDAEVRRSSLEALRRLREERAVPLAVVALDDPETALRALELLGELGGPEQAAAVTELARRQPSAEILAAAGKVLAGWISKAGIPPQRRIEVENALAEIHGSSGILLGWHVLGPVTAEAARDLAAKLATGDGLPSGKDAVPGWRLVLSTSMDSRVSLGTGTEAANVWIGYTEIAAGEPALVEFSATGSGTMTVWLNGKVAYLRDRAMTSAERFEAALEKGRNRLVVQLARAKGKSEFQLRCRRKGATTDHERLTRSALSRAGDPERGRQVFLNAEKAQCIKCHRVGEQGERVGPELTGLGSRFSKVYIVESILEPSRTIAPSFDTLLVGLKDGRTLSGVKVAETASAITLVDNQAQKHVIARADIEAQQKQAVSTMPEGLEKRLTEQEFVDLISYLADLKEPRGR